MSHTVMVVDDELHIRKILGLKLGQRGLEVVQAVDGQHGLELLEAGLEPDAVVLDIMMPNLDGITLLGKLRADERWKDLPIVMLSAVREDDDVAKVVDLGVIAYVRKPFNTKELCDMVEAAAKNGGPAPVAGDEAA